MSTTPHNHIHEQSGVTLEWGYDSDPNPASECWTAYHGDYVLIIQTLYSKVDPFLLWIMDDDSNTLHEATFYTMEDARTAAHNWAAQNA